VLVDAGGQVRLLDFGIAKLLQGDSAVETELTRESGRAAQTVIEEVRRQFKANPGIMQGTSDPDYGTCVDIVTKSALKAMVVPGLLAVASPVAVGMLFRLFADPNDAFPVGTVSVAAARSPSNVAPHMPQNLCGKVYGCPHSAHCRDGGADTASTIRIVSGEVICARGFSAGRVAASSSRGNEALPCSSRRSSSTASSRFSGGLVK